MMKYLSVFVQRRAWMDEMSNNLQDQELLRRYVRDGSEPAFRQLVERHVDLVYGAAFRRLTDRPAAEEIVQNTFVALACRAPFLVAHPSVAGWLYHTAANLARRQFRTDLRRRSRETAAVQLANLMPPDPNHPFAGVLDEVLLELRSADREALVLRYFENKSVRDVGAALGIQEDAAQKRIARALESLTQKMRRRGCAVPVVAAGAALSSASQAAPAGLAAAASKAAFAAGGAASIGGLTLLAARFLMLTKPQAIAACALIAAAPVALEYNSVAAARNERTALHNRIAELQNQNSSQQRALDQAQSRLRSATSVLAGIRNDTARQRAAARSAAATNFYAWSDSSDYVRFPKAMIDSLSLVTQVKHAPIDASGTEALQQALGVTPAEAANTETAFKKLEQDYRRLMMSHAYLTNQPPTNFQVGAAKSLTLVTRPFGDASTALQSNLRTALESALGAERAGALWQQADPLFSDDFNGFGTRERTETVSLDSNGMILYWKQTSIPGEQFSYSYLHMGMGTNVVSAPEPFRPFLAAQIKKFAANRAAKNP